MKIIDEIIEDIKSDPRHKKYGWFDKRGWKQFKLVVFIIPLLAVFIVVSMVVPDTSPFLTGPVDWLIMILILIQLEGFIILKDKIYKIENRLGIK